MSALQATIGHVSNTGPPRQRRLQSRRKRGSQ